MVKSLRRVVFEFLNDILGDQQRVNIFGLIVIVIQYTQIYAAQFAPFIFGNKEKCSLDSFLSYIVLFSNSTDTYFDAIYAIYILYGIFILIIVSFFWAFTQKIRTRGFFKYIRTIIRIFPSIILLYPLIGHAGLKLHDYTYEKAMWYDFFLIILDLIFYTLFILLEYYLTPVIAGSPLCGHSHMPSRILPDFGFTNFVQQDYLSFFLIVSSQNQIIIYIYCFYQVVLSIRRIIILSNNPFNSIAHTNAATVLSFTIILVQLGYILSLGIPDIHASHVLIASLIFFVFGYAIVELVRTISYHKIQIAIEANDLEYLKKIDPQKLFQFVLGKDIGNDSILKLIYKKSKGNFHILMKILSRKLDCDVDMLIETSDYLFSFVVFRQTQKVKPDKITEDPSLIFNSDKFWCQMIKGKINEAMHDIIEHSKSSIFSLQNVNTENPLQSNLRKLLKKENPIQETALFFSIYVFFSVFSIVAIYPLFRLSFNIENFVNVPRVLRKSMNIGILWSELMLGIEHSVNCTIFNNLTIEEVVKLIHINNSEPKYTVPRTVGDFNKNLGPIALQITDEVTEMNTYLDGMVSEGFSYHINQLWYMPKILFPMYIGNNMTYMDMRSVLMYYLAEIILYHDDSNHYNKLDWCDSRLTNHFRENMYFFMNSSLELLMYYSSFVDSYMDYILVINKQFNVRTTNVQITHIVFFFAMSLVADLLWNYWRYKRLFRTISTKYRIKFHPSFEDVEYEEEATKMNIFNDMLRVFLIHFCCGMLFLIITYLLKLESEYLFDTMMKYNMISVRIENLSLTFSLSMHSYFRSYLFDEKEFVDQFLSKMNEFETIITNLDNSFNPLNLKVFKDKSNLPYLMQFHDNGEMIESFHDIYSSWPIMPLVFLMNSMITDTPKLYPLNPNSLFYVHLTHMNLVHFQPGIDQVHEMVSQFSEDQSKFLSLTIALSVIVFCIYLIGVFFMLYRKYVRMERCHRILSSHILNLDPVFLLTQRSIIDYLLGTKKENVTSVTSLKELFMAADVPLILVGKKDIIVQYTKPILKMFGMRDDQLIGHSLKTIIKDDQKRFGIHVNNRIAGTLDVKGIYSNDELFSIEVKITPLSHYVLLEFKMIDEILDFEELIQVHSDLYNEYICTSYPSFIIQPCNLVYEDIYQRMYPKFAFLFVTTETQAGDNEYNIESIKHYFSESIVLFYNCSVWISIFVGENSLADAVRCYQCFGLDDERKAGIILEGTDLLVMFFGLPDNIDWIDPKDIMTAIPPHVSIEPKLDLYNYIRYLNKLSMGKLVACQTVSKYFDDSVVSQLDDELVAIRNEYIDSAQFFIRSSLMQMPFGSRMNPNNSGFEPNISSFSVDNIY